MTSPLPSIVWLPVELLFFGSVSGIYHIVTGLSFGQTHVPSRTMISFGDWSLMVEAEDVLKDRRRFFTMDARIAARNVLEFNLLNDSQVIPFLQPPMRGTLFDSDQSRPSNGDISLLLLKRWLLVCRSHLCAFPLCFDGHTRYWTLPYLQGNAEKQFLRHLQVSFVSLLKHLTKHGSSCWFKN